MRQNLNQVVSRILPKGNAVIAREDASSYIGIYDEYTSKELSKPFKRTSASKFSTSRVNIELFNTIYNKKTQAKYYMAMIDLIEEFEDIGNENANINSLN